MSEPRPIRYPWLSHDRRTVVHYQGPEIRNRCCRCDHEWPDVPVAFSPVRECPRCASAYWKWVDFRPAA